MKTDPTFWLLARASGLTAYVLLTTTALAGLVLKSRPFGRAVKAAALTDVHRFLTFLALGALALHGVALTLDRTVHMSLTALVVPGASTYRPIPVALGVLACELAVLIAVSFSVRRRIGFRNWRRLHLADVPPVRLRNRPRHRGRHGLVAAVGVRPLPRGGGRRRLRHVVAGAQPPHAPNPCPRS